MMTRLFKEIRSCLGLLPQALAVVLVVSAPLLTVSQLRAADATIIQAPTMKKTGAGFVLMMSLRRG